jgi:hypothetical protein
VTLRLADHKAGTHSQRRKDLEHVSIKTDGVAEHDVVSFGCREEAKQVKKGIVSKCCKRGNFYFEFKPDTYSDYTFLPAKASDPARHDEELQHLSGDL